MGRYFSDAATNRSTSGAFTMNCTMTDICSSLPSAPLRLAQVRPDGKSAVAASGRPSGPGSRLRSMRGDRVEIVVDSGSGVLKYEIEATEVTRSGAPVRSGRFMADRVVALVEHPAPPAPRRGRRPPRGQASLV